MVTRSPVTDTESVSPPCPARNGSKPEPVPEGLPVGDNPATAHTPKLVGQAPGSRRVRSGPGTDRARSKSKPSSSSSAWSWTNFDGHHHSHRTHHLRSTHRHPHRKRRHRYCSCRKWFQLFCRKCTTRHRRRRGCRELYRLRRRLKQLRRTCSRTLRRNRNRRCCLRHCTNVHHLNHHGFCNT